LRDEVATYTAYLRSLASKLSHEINTPLAIVRLDLAGLLRECGEAYRSLLAPRRLDLVFPAAAMPLHGAPELIMQALDKLFDSLVSVRSRNRADGSIHLCLGLHMVKLVADLHRGSVYAHDLADGNGVQFSLHLQGIRTAAPPLL